MRSRRLVLAGLMTVGSLIGLTAQAADLPGGCAAVGGAGDENTCTFNASATDYHFVGVGKWSIDVLRGNQTLHADYTDAYLHKENGVNAPTVTLAMSLEDGDVVTLSADGSGSAAELSTPGGSLKPGL